MPAMTGLELLKRVQEKHLRLPVILMSAGYRIHSYELSQGVIGFLQKPFQLADLLSRLSEAFSSVGDELQEGTRLSPMAD